MMIFIMNDTFIIYIHANKKSQYFALPLTFKMDNIFFNKNMFIYWLS